MTAPTLREPVAIDVAGEGSLRRLDLPMATLGEGPVWDARHAALVWVDLRGAAIHRFQPSSGRREMLPTGQRTGAIAPRRNGGYVVALADGFWCVDGDFKRLEQVLPLPGEVAGRWMNDARCDPYGRLWAGVALDALIPGSGALFCLDGAWRLRCVLDGYTLSNGLGWSPDGARMYHVDSRRQVVFQYDFDGERGLPSNPIRLIEIPSEEGSPDGLSVDLEGCIWLAVWDAGLLRRYAPDGRPLSQIRLPPRRVSSCAFGGRDMRDLYVTTARSDVPPEEAERTQAGSLFVTRSPVAGLPVPTFVG